MVSVSRTRTAHHDLGNSACKTGVEHIAGSEDIDRIFEFPCAFLARGHNGGEVADHIRSFTPDQFSSGFTSHVGDAFFDLQWMPSSAGKRADIDRDNIRNPILPGQGVSDQ